jgi:hypothetical protein
MGHGLGVALSLVCLVHCAAAPILLMAAPMLGDLFTSDVNVHRILALCAGPLAAVTLVPSLHRRDARWFAIVGLIGAGLVGVSACVAQPGDCCWPFSGSMRPQPVSLRWIVSLTGTPIGCLLLLGAHWAISRRCCKPAS